MIKFLKEHWPELAGALVAGAARTGGATWLTFNLTHDRNLAIVVMILMIAEK